MLQRLELQVDGTQRYYLLHVPAGEPASAEGRWPVVLAFHGGGSTPLDMARFCGLMDTAARHRFAVVFPAGSGPSPEYLTWNAGICCGHASRREVDDVAFAQAVLDDLPRRLLVDASRVYATGMSNGGMLCYRLAAALPERIAAIAPVAGTLAFDPVPLTRPVPVLHFHGTDDAFVAYEGGPGTRSLRQVEFRSSRDSLITWTRACGLPGVEPEYEPIAIDSPLSNDRCLAVRRAVFGRIDECDAIMEVCIDGGGHTWPGQAPPLCFLGKTLLSLPANEWIWEFFGRFRTA